MLTTYEQSGTLIGLFIAAYIRPKEDLSKPIALTNYTLDGDVYLLVVNFIIFLRTVYLIKQSFHSILSINGFKANSVLENRWLYDFNVSDIVVHHGLTFV